MRSEVAIIVIIVRSEARGRYYCEIAEVFGFTVIYNIRFYVCIHTYVYVCICVYTPHTTCTFNVTNYSLTHSSSTSLFSVAPNIPGRSSDSQKPIYCSSTSLLLVVVRTIFAIDIVKLVCCSFNPSSY